MLAVAVISALGSSQSVADGGRNRTDVERHQYDVVIAGGSTAAFAAAVSAAQSGARVALLEPTDWIGGQITSSGVPAIDEAWHRLTRDDGEVLIDVAKIARTPENISPLFRDMLTQTGCPGNCWVSRFCFLPKRFLDEHLLPLEVSLPRLRVFRNTVVKAAEAKAGRVTALLAVERIARSGVRHDGYDRLPSQDLVDWYAISPSARFDKTLHRFDSDGSTVFMDATEWGEVLALSGAPYLQGVEQTDGGLEGDDTLGQAITYDFVQELHEEPDALRDRNVPAGPAANEQQLGLGDYRDKPDGWELVWTYRRVASSAREIRAGDLCLQNWGYYPERNETGNDYPFGYFFLTKQAAARERDDWHGGIDLEVMSAAEQHAYAWHHYFKSIAPDRIGADRISLARHVLGTGHGLAKLPYIRDTRRSVGLDDFLLTVADLQPVGGEGLARRFVDRIAIGAYPVDIHKLANRAYPEYVDRHYDVAPFTIPFRALTNKRFGNLLVAGKTMAQSFLANSATRLHPIEWSTGTAAGVVSAIMHREKKTSRQLFDEISQVQEEVRKYTPIDWTIR